MKKTTFKAEVLSGHKEDAVEVPFDPAKEWGIPPKSLWRGRRGHVVNATVNGFSFESSIVPRQKKFYLLINGESERAARITDGDVVTVTVQPQTP
jgi:ribosomal protein L21E